MRSAAPALYTRLAPWFHLLTHPSSYKEEAAYVAKLLEPNGKPKGRKPTMLELGSGGGNNALHLKRHFDLTLTDLSPQMLTLSKRINPELEHIAGDMRTLRLKRQFDCVFIHDAIMYMTTARDLARAIETAASHTKPGGRVLIQPDFVEETFETEIETGGHAEDGRTLGYLMTQTRKGRSSTVTVDFTVAMRGADGRVRTAQDRHVVGLFPRVLWVKLLERNGLRVRQLTDPWKRDCFLGTLPR